MIDRLRELLRAATPGPWSGDEDGHVYPESGPVTSEVRARGIIVDIFGGRHAADAALIVEAINALPELLDAHDRMAGALDKAERLNAMLPNELTRLADMLEAKVPLPSNRTDYFEGWLDAVRAVREELLAVRAALAVPKEENPDA